MVEYEIKNDKKSEVPLTLWLEKRIDGNGNEGILVKARRGDGYGWSICEFQKDGTLLLYRGIGRDTGLKLDDDYRIVTTKRPVD